MENIHLMSANVVDVESQQDPSQRPFQCNSCHIDTSGKQPHLNLKGLRFNHLALLCSSSSVCFFKSSNNNSNRRHWKDLERRLLCTAALGERLQY